MGGGGAACAGGLVGWGSGAGPAARGRVQPTFQLCKAEHHIGRPALPVFDLQGRNGAAPGDDVHFQQV